MKKLDHVSTKQNKATVTIFFPIVWIYVFVVNLISIAALKIPGRVKSCLFNLTIFLIAAITVWRWLNSDLRDLIEWDHIVVLYIVLFVLLLVFSIDRKVSANDIHWNVMFWIGWFLCFIFIFASAFTHTVKTDYFLWGAMSLFYFPLLYVVWQTRNDYSVLFSAVAWSNVVCSYIFIIVSLLGALVFRNELFPQSFLGVVGNPNANGMLAVGFFASAFYLAFEKKQMNVYALITVSISIALAIESICRTAVLAFLVITILGWIFYIKVNRDDISEVIKKVLISIIVVLCLTVPFCFLFKTVNSMDLYTYAASGNGTISPDVYNTLNVISSGRLDLWRVYTQDINLFGHGLMDTSSLSEVYRWAHNNLLDILYISGALAAFGYLIWMLYSLFFVMRCTFRKTMERPEYLFVIASVIGYFIEAMLEITIFPMTTGIALMAFMGLALVSGEKNR